MDFDKVKSLDVPNHLSKKIINYSKFYIEPSVKKVALKYFGLFFFSIFISLVICPQNGVGLLRESFPIYHHIFHNNLLLCGLYCGFMFFVTTHILSFYILNHYERVVVLRKIGYMPILFMSVFFAFSMTPLFSMVEFSLIYTFGWLGISFSSYFLHRKLFFKSINIFS